MIRKILSLIFLFSFISLSFTGCKTSRAPGSKPEDMSHKEHMEAAEKEKKEAEHHESMYDPTATFPQDYLWGDPAFNYRAYSTESDYYNPTEYHRHIATKHHEHASHHKEAAETLKKFEEEECKTIHPEVRHMCPLIGTVKAVEEVEGGARLILKEKVDVNGVYAHSKCHNRYGAVHGFKEMPNCPLYLKGISIEKKGKNTIEIRSKDGSDTEEIRRRSEAHLD